MHPTRKETNWDGWRIGRPRERIEKGEGEDSNTIGTFEVCPEAKNYLYHLLTYETRSACIRLWHVEPLHSASGRGRVVFLSRR